MIDSENRFTIELMQERARKFSESLEETRLPSGVHRICGEIEYDDGMVIGFGVELRGERKGGFWQRLRDAWQAFSR